MKINTINSYQNLSNINNYNKNICFEGGKAIYAGSFDPITKGHLDLIKEASKLFDNLVVLIARNPKNKAFYL